MFFNVIPYATSYGDRVVFMRSEDIDSIEIVEGTPHFIGSDPTKKQFYLDMIASLDKDASLYSKYGMENIWYQCKYLFADQPHLRVIVDDAHLLFANKKPRSIIKILYGLASMAQSAERQFLLVGNSELLESANAVRNYQEKQPYDRGWLLARMTVIDRSVYLNTDCD